MPWNPAALAGSVLLLMGLSGPPSAAQGVVVEGTIRVQVVGMVRRPGMYRLSPGTRTADAIQAAGGIQPGADLEGLNLASGLQDGQSVLVPRRGARAVSPGAMTARPTATATRRTEGGPLALNAASAAQLEALPGIGAAIAADIVAYRHKKGAFRSLDELREVPGIGERRLNRLKPHLRL